jgi:hypothetical protein
MLGGAGYIMGYRRRHRVNSTFTVNYLRETCDSDPSLQCLVQRRPGESGRSQGRLEFSARLNSEIYVVAAAPDLNPPAGRFTISPRNEYMFPGYA